MYKNVKLNSKKCQKGPLTARNGQKISNMSGNHKTGIIDAVILKFKIQHFVFELEGCDYGWQLFSDWSITFWHRL